MKIRIIRIIEEEKRTIGSLFVNGKFQCYTLEDKIRKEKIYGETAILKGTYDVKWHYSNRFKEYMPAVLNVPNFQGILFHAGNTEHDTEGCILLGTNYNDWGLTQSMLAFNNFISLLPSRKAIYEIKLTIEEVIKL